MQRKASVLYKGNPFDHSNSPKQGTERRSSSDLARRKTSVHPTSKESRKGSSFHNFYKNVFIPESMQINQLLNDDRSVSASTNNTFTEKDFKLPDLEVQIGMDLNDILLHDKHKRQFRALKYELVREQDCLTRLDKLSHTTDSLLSRRSKGSQLSTSATRKLRVKLESEAELSTIRQIVTRQPGELVDKLKEMKEQIESESVNGIDDDQRESSIDHPALDSVHEKMEDLRQEECEKWCVLHGKAINEKYTNLEKRMLRKWFKELDYDGSGEVNVEELQDPMLSAGILKTREQVVRVLANVDRNGTMGIDFEEFLVALSANKLADKHKLKHLQEMSAHPYFSVDTLITEERRKKLIKSILRQSQKRQSEIDALYRKYDKPKLTKKERETWVRELELLEERQSRSIFLHSKYIHALEGVLEDKKEFYSMQLADRLRQLEEERLPDALDALINRPGHHLANENTSTAGGDNNSVADSWHARHSNHHHHHNHSNVHSPHGNGPGIAMSDSHSGHHAKLRSEEFERLPNPFSIYAPPTPKYNKKK